ncbi:CRAL-TRIO domain-containing protein [Mycena crocata]|nr:CRAL-TRIO domain-containing protein [Mycena crocata]
MSENVYLPIRPPAKLGEPRPELKEEEQKMQQEVQKHFEDPAYTPSGSEETLTAAEKMWLSYECILRYLRASKWKVDVAIRRVEDTLKWRREYGVYDTVTAEHVQSEAVTGKQILLGYDTSNRPGMYLIPSRQNTTESTRQVQFTVWMLERCIDLMPAGVESLTLLINYADKAKNPSLATSRAVLNILQDHYPERLGLALILNVPFLINAFFKLITPFIDPITRNKMKFNPQVIQDGIFTPEMVMSQWWGGDCNFEYDHDKYWPALVSMCDERTKAWTAAWHKMGGKVGLKEYDYKTDAPNDATHEPTIIAPTSES